MAQKLFFLADDSGSDDFDLWVSDGTQAGTTPVGGISNTQVADSATGGLGPGFLTVFGNQMIFAGSDSLNNASTNGLWLTDGTADGTTEVGGPSPGSLNPPSPFTNGDPDGLKPQNFTTFGSKAIFTGWDSGNFEGLWVTDGTVAGTLELGGLNNQITGSDLGAFSTQNFAAFNNSVLFDGKDSTGFMGLWISDGTSAGTVEIGDSQNHMIFDSGLSGFEANDFVTLGALELFSAPNAQGNDSLWITDGTAGGTVEVGGANNSAVIGGKNTGLGDGLAQSVRFGDRVLFGGNDTDGGTGLWATDGTATGTTEIGGLDDAGVNTAAQSTSPNGLHPQDITVNSGAVLFNGADGFLNTNELWISDGTTAGTLELTGGLADEATSGSGLDPQDIVSLGNGKAVFFGLDSNNNNKPTLWVTDGTRAGTQEIGGVNNEGIADASTMYGLTPQIDTLMGSPISPRQIRPARKPQCFGKRTAP
jgi:ELWxxDGT repeat protein